ncbi:MAG: ABC transporter substrate-binding protein [Clostridium tyrobutyricum]|jgi:NitT/TauT family transport system substrate-binding protein|uniref:ABC transporter substrate-binding protein n=1 Tax=Clostridium tyrobutyricum TaxID=1519 RepID=UPI0005801980|nr:ABC transporter substrate-binding protein [Clostridium tyrobutyricum]MBR9647330.1 ABC transporter substrate-binding protein [Clostridium tyrobutyricum]MCH4199972.1 ABC transporter substrate-binding protein [Clostridium tyrobutyricum]MCH4237581.1 ABC transporter substrate-binding protein [Clostridium tyrobutyricum]MCH4259963.1 ABC transporter substrate-binding protein [Clostridium tyrobutyricum]MCI1240312.1 ABC transporter substrate-binding protein [Clostridium tyrobutyricum]
MKKLKKLFICVLALSLVLGLTACGNKTPQGNNGKKTIKIAYLPITHSVPLFVESENSKSNKDQFKNVNIELVKFGTWPELMDALNTGKVDGASVLIQLAMKAKEQGIDLKAVALGHRDGTNIIVSKDINSAADLKGKTIAIPQKFSTMNILLYQALKNAGISYSDVKTVELQPAEMPSALAEKRVSGYIVAEPFASKSVVNGKGKILQTSADIWKNSICCGLILRNDFIKNNREAAQQFVDGYVKAGKEAETKNDKIQKIASKYMNVDKDVLDLSLKYTSYTDLKIEKNDYNVLIKYLTTMNLLKDPPKYNDFVETSLINKAEK